MRLPTRCIEGIEIGVEVGLGVDHHQAIGFGTIEKDKDSQIATCAELHSGDLAPIRQHHNFRRKKVPDFDERQTASVLHRNILSNRMRAGVSVSDSSLCEIRDHSQKRCRDGYPEERDNPSREQGRGLRRSGVLVPADGPTFCRPPCNQIENGG